MENCGVTHSGIPSPDIKQLLIIPLGNLPYYRKKTPTVSSGNPLNTDTIKMHQLKPQPKLHSKDKESTPLSIGVASGWVSTEVDCTTAINPKPTRC